MLVIGYVMILFGVIIVSLNVLKIVWYVSYNGGDVCEELR